MNSMTQTLKQLKKEKEELDEAIAVLEQLSRQLEKTRRVAGSEAKLSSEGARSKTGKGAAIGSTVQALLTTVAAGRPNGSSRACSPELPPCPTLRSHPAAARSKSIRTALPRRRARLSSSLG